MFNRLRLIATFGDRGEKGRPIQRAVCGALVAVAIPAAGLAAAPLAGAAQICMPAQSTTLASDTYARVYGKSGRAYVCVRSSGRITMLLGASPLLSQFALAGTYVGWSSGVGKTVVKVMHIPNLVIPKEFPYDTNNHVDRIVVKSDGATAWAATPSGDNTYVQGFDRSNHSADLLSDDTLNVRGTSLRSLAGTAISWQYTDGTTGTANLY